MTKHLFMAGIVTLFVLTGFANAQTNLLQNPNAELRSQFWQTYGQATVESCIGIDPCFVVRNHGYFIQDVAVPADAAGGYALFVGRGSSERVNADGAITGLPYLYGYMMDETKKRVLAYLQGQNMLLFDVKKDEWRTLCGVFPVPQGTGTIRFFLDQAERKGVPQNGSAARFDDVGLYLFSTESDARAFASGRGCQ